MFFMDPVSFTYVAHSASSQSSSFTPIRLSFVGVLLCDYDVGVYNFVIVFLSWHDLRLACSCSCLRVDYYVINLPSPPVRGDARAQRLHLFGL